MFGVPVVWEKYENMFEMSSAEIFTPALHLHSYIQ